MTVVLPAFLLLATTAYLRWRTQSWLHPSTMFATVWSCYILLAFVLCFDVEVWPGTIWLLLGAVLSFSMASLLLPESLGRLPLLKTSASLPGKAQHFIFWLMIASTGAGFAAFIALVLSSEKGLSTLFSASDFAAMASNYTTMRYRGHSEPLAFRILTPWIYVGPMLASLLLVHGTLIKRRKYYFLTLVPAILVTIALTTKATMLAVVSMALGMYLAALLRVDRSKRTIRPKSILIIAIVAVIFLLIFVVVTMVRYEWTDLGMLWTALDRLRLDFFGFLGPISVWLPEYISNPTELTWGSSSFPGPFQILGIKAREIGTYSTSINIGSGRPSNIYTAYRGLIMDFGIAGAYGFLFIVGSLISWCSSISDRFWFSIPILGGVFYATFWSHVIFSFGYNTTIASWGLMLLLMVVIDSSEKMFSHWGTKPFDTRDDI